MRRCASPGSCSARSPGSAPAATRSPSPGRRPRPRRRPRHVGDGGHLGAPAAPDHLPGGRPAADQLRRSSSFPNARGVIPVKFALSAGTNPAILQSVYSNSATEDDFSFLAFAPGGALTFGGLTGFTASYSFTQGNCGGGSLRHGRAVRHLAAPGRHLLRQPCRRGEPVRRAPGGAGELGAGRRPVQRPTRCSAWAAPRSTTTPSPRPSPRRRLPPALSRPRRSR